MIVADAIHQNQVPPHPPYEYPSVWRQTTSCASGPDAEQRNAVAQLARAHWCERPTIILLQFVENDSPAYQHITPTPIKSVRTQYKYIGRLRAREFPIDE